MPCSTGHWPLHIRSLNCEAAEGIGTKGPARWSGRILQSGSKLGEIEVKREVIDSCQGTSSTTFMEDVLEDVRVCETVHFLESRSSMMLHVVVGSCN